MEKGNNNNYMQDEHGVQDEAALEVLFCPGQCQAGQGCGPFVQSIERF